MHPRCRLFLVVLILVPPTARAGEFTQAPPAPGMALTLPDPGMANSAPAPAAPPEAVAPPPPQVDLTGGRRLRALGSGFSSIEGRLPNQRTGPRHEHVVRDICIGC
jgi:hypothetical protein